MSVMKPGCVLLTALSFASVCMAIDRDDRLSAKKAPAQKDAPKNPSTVDRQGRPEVESVRKASSIVGAEVQAPNGQSLGTVEELALDLDKGLLAAVLIKTREGGDKVFAVPPSSLKSEKSKLILKNDLGHPITRQKALGGSPGFAEIQGEKIHNTKGKSLGTLDDLAIDLTSGIIAYAAVSNPELAKEEHLPIPLSAFVVKPDADAWILELPDDILVETPRIPRADWPEKIDRGWVEYVHVRYGQSPFGGVRRELRAESHSDAADQKSDSDSN